MTDDEIVDVMTSEEEEEEEGEAATAVHTVGRDMAVNAFRTSLEWTEENGVSACEILVLIKLQEKTIKVSFQPKKQEEN